jgi:GNAT superfamily N-acetyltransferase
MPGVEHRPHKGLNNRAENSHQPTRRRERIMKRFKAPRQVQRFLSTHDQIANVFSRRRAKTPPQGFILLAVKPSPSGPRLPEWRWLRNYARRRPPLNPSRHPIFHGRQVDGAISTPFTDTRNRKSIRLFNGSRDDKLRDRGSCRSWVESGAQRYRANLPDMPNPTIRLANQADLPGMLNLYRHLNPDDPVPDPAKAEAAWASLIHSRLATVLIAEIAGAPVSSCTLLIVPNLTRGARSYGVIENVVTHRDHRRTGLGRAVLQAALDIAWAADCYKVMLATGSRREETLRFYACAGFERGRKTFFEARRP